MTTITPSVGPVILLDRGPIRTRPETPVREEARDYANTMLEAHERIVGPTEVAEGADFEDFWEEAARSYAGLAGTAGDFLLLDEDEGLARHFTTGEKQSLEFEPSQNRWGSQAGTLHRRYGDDWINRNPQAAGTNKYWQFEAFREHCGRRIDIVPFDREEDCHVEMESVIESWPFDTAFLKFGTQKGYPLMSIPASMQGWRGSDMYLGTLSCTADILVQEEVPMRFEYRVFVVGGKVRTAAGNVERHTPLDNYLQNDFDDRMEFIRSASPVAREPELMERYLIAAEKIAADFAAEGMLDYSLDLAVVSDGRTDRVVVVEINCLTNSGLYACNPVRIVEGLMGR